MTRLSSRAVGAFFRLLISACLLSWAATQVPSARAEEPDEKAKRSQIISRTTMSPFCPGRTLDSCPSPYATEWREDIRAMVEKGMTTDEIRVALEKRTATDLSGSPSTMMDGVLPAIVTLIAVLFLIFLLRGLVRSRKEEIGNMADTEKAKPAEDKNSDDADDQLLDERLRAELENMEDHSLDDR